MKKLFIIANWKSNGTIHSSEEWFQAMNNPQLTGNKEEKEIILCPPFTLLAKVKELAFEKQIAIGSQDYSAFDAGAHTGEEPPELLKEYVQYAIVGHSERRQQLFESDELIAKKIANANKYGITPVLCVQGVDTPIPEGVSIVAYEPIFAIGTGNPDTPENAESVIKRIKEKHGVQYILYGGSVVSENVKSFTGMPSVDGVLVGGASLDAEKFKQIIENA
jgi:triosephosphate isomerase